MFTNIEDLKKFIIWAKTQKLHSVEVEGVKFEISPYAFIDSIGEVPTPQTEPIETPTDEELLIMNENFQNKEDEDLLYHSSQP